MSPTPPAWARGAAPAGGGPTASRLPAARRAGLDKRRLGAVDQEAGGHPVHAAQQGVDLADARSDQVHGPEPTCLRGGAGTRRRRRGRLLRLLKKRGQLGGVRLDDVLLLAEGGEVALLE